MKPISLGIVHMGKKGLELSSIHPKVLPDKIMKEIAYKCMPLGSKPGDFTTTSSGDMYFSSYIFRVPTEDERNNIASLIAIFSSTKYNPESIKRVFSLIISELQSKALLKIEILEEILPSLYKGFNKGSITIRVSSVAKISIDFSDEDEGDIDETNDFASDLWK